VLAFVKTSGLVHAKADLAAWFADEQGNLIPASEAHSQSFAAANNGAAGPGGDTWEVLYIYMPGPGLDKPGNKNASATARAKSLVLQMGVLQPQQLVEENGGKNAELGKFQIYQQDIAGSAWFDDLVVFQLPRVSSTIPDAPGNIFAPGQ